MTSRSARLIHINIKYTQLVRQGPTWIVSSRSASANGYSGLCGRQERPNRKNVSRGPGSTPSLHPSAATRTLNLNTTPPGNTNHTSQCHAACSGMHGHGPRVAAPRRASVVRSDFTSVRFCFCGPITLYITLSKLVQHCDS